jgi:hypothetical protein
LAACLDCVHFAQADTKLAGKLSLSEAEPLALLGDAVADQVWGMLGVGR